MHSAQDAIAGVYSLLQLHGPSMAQTGQEGHDAICAAAEAMLTSLKVSEAVLTCVCVCLIHAHCLTDHWHDGQRRSTQCYCL